MTIAAVLIIIATAIYSAWYFPQYSEASAEHHQEMILESEKQEITSVVVDKYVRRRHVAKVTHRDYYIEVYNGEEEPYRFEVSGGVYGNTDVGDNVKLVIYTVDGQLYNVFIVTEDGTHIECCNRIDLRRIPEDR